MKNFRKLVLLPTFQLKPLGAGYLFGIFPVKLVCKSTNIVAGYVSRHVSLGKQPPNPHMISTSKSQPPPEKKIDLWHPSGWPVVPRAWTNLKDYLRYHGKMMEYAKKKEPYKFCNSLDLLRIYFGSIRIVS